MAYMNRFNLSDEHRRNELIRIVEHSVESALAESLTSYCTIKGTDEDCLSRQSFLYILEKDKTSTENKRKTLKLFHLFSLD